MTWPRAGRVALACAVLLLARTRPPALAAAPAVEVIEVPPAAEGGEFRLGTIAGRVSGAGNGQRIVLYARSGDWYVQPYADQPFTAIQPDSTWTSSTHLGTEYAALLVDAGYRPLARTPALPGVGGGVAAVTVTEGVPPWWKTRWFRVACFVVAVLGAASLHRHRLRQLARELDARSDERLEERTRIAQELYDTLLQGFMSASMRLHLAVDQLPEGSPDRARLDQALAVMGRATDEARRVLHGLRCTADDGEPLEGALGRLARDLGPDVVADYRVTVEGTPRRLHPIIRDEVYRLGREAVVNALRHARARSVLVEIAYAPGDLRMVVRDDGCGIDPGVLASSEGDCGVPGMRKRADRIGARLRIRSQAGTGTEVELSVPEAVAFHTQAASSRRETVP
jgi:signal transduction histidine kinase